MVLDILRESKLRILLASAISILAGAANIWLLALVNRDMHHVGVELNAIAEFGAALLLMVTVSFISQMTLSRLSAGTLFRLREQLVQGITHLSTQKTESIGRHKLYAALTKDVPSVHELLIALPNYLFNLTVAIACLIYLAMVSPRLFLLFMVFLIIGLSVAKFAIADRAEKRFQMRRKVENDLFKCYEAVIDGGKELKLNQKRGHQFIRDELQCHAEKYRDATTAAEFLLNMSNNWATAMIFIGIGALLFLSPHIGLSDTSLTTTFVMTIFYLVGPLTILMNSFRTIHAAKVGIKHLKDLQLDAVPRTYSAPTSAEPFRSMSARGVSFHYESAEESRAGFSVGPLDLDIYRGEIVYFVGGNGSGKTTATKLLTGLYERHAGKVLINDVEAVDPKACFQYFSAIFQDYHLFETLVSKRGQDPDPREVQSWLERLHLTDKVSVEQGRLSTTRLSYGQRKRLALLIAYFEQSEFYVFDEWAADQDQEFRDFFYCEFLPELKRLGKTALVVSHDERYFHLADKVVKFESGTVVSIERNTLPHASSPAFSAVLDV